MTKPYPSNEFVDAAIFVALGTNRYKVARAIGDVAASTSAEHDHIANRISALVAQNKLESFGDIENWRHSEIKIRT